LTTFDTHGRGVSELQDEIHELRKQQEEMALKSNNTRDIPCLPAAKGIAPLPYPRLTRCRFFCSAFFVILNNARLFSPLAMQTASVELNHIFQKALCPQPGLQIFLLGAFANIIDSKPHRDQSLRLVGVGGSIKRKTPTQDLSEPAN
jgi:hypothetical protein